MGFKRCLLASAVIFAVAAPASAQSDNMSKLQQMKTTGTSLDIPQIEQGGAKAAQLQETTSRSIDPTSILASHSGHCRNTTHTPVLSSSENSSAPQGRCVTRGKFGCKRSGRFAEISR